MFTTVVLLSGASILFDLWDGYNRTPMYFLEGDDALSGLGGILGYPIGGVMCIYQITTNISYNHSLIKTNIITNTHYNALYSDVKTHYSGYTSNWIATRERTLDNVSGASLAGIFKTVCQLSASSSSPYYYNWIFHKNNGVSTTGALKVSNLERVLLHGLQWWNDASDVVYPVDRESGG
jgi:hypothetical protein